LEVTLKSQLLIVFTSLIITILLIGCTLPEVEDVDAPVVAILYPYDGSVVSGNIIVSVQATDDKEVKEVGYHLDGRLMEKSERTSKEFELNVTPLADELEHAFQAFAKDEAGNKGFSERILVTLSKTGDIIPPTVEIVNPIAGQEVADSVLITANALDDRIISEVAFFIDGDSVDSDFIYPFEHMWLVEGIDYFTSHSIFARAFDGARNFANSLSVTVTVVPVLDRVPPIARLIYPLFGQVLIDTVVVNVDASDDQKLDRVDFYIDGELKKSANANITSSPFTYTWDTTPLEPESSHSLYFQAIDKAGNKSTNEAISFTVSRHDVEPPVARLIYPLIGQILVGTIEVKVDATDDQKLEKVDFYIDGLLRESVDAGVKTSPFTYSWNTTPLEPESSHSLYFQAVDTGGNRSTNEAISFTIGREDAEPPALVLLYPVAGDTLTGTVGVAVDVSDNVAIDRVEYYVDGGLLGVPNYTAVSPPWHYQWNTTPWVAIAGPHTLYIKAFDTSENVTTVGPITYAIR
jgi:chitinase